MLCDGKTTVNSCIQCCKTGLWQSNEANHLKIYSLLKVFRPSKKFYPWTLSFDKVGSFFPCWRKRDTPELGFKIPSKIPPSKVKRFKYVDKKFKCYKCLPLFLLVSTVSDITQPPPPPKKKGNCPQSFGLMSIIWLLWKSHWTQDAPSNQTLSGIQYTVVIWIKYISKSYLQNDTAREVPLKQVWLLRTPSFNENISLYSNYWLLC